MIETIQETPLLTRLDLPDIIIPDELSSKFRYLEMSQVAARTLVVPSAPLY
jgi:hypothetical protein